jgi:hypothetical protein
MWDMLSSHYFPYGSQVVETLQSNPEAFGAWFTIAFASKEISETGYHAGSIAKRWRKIRRYRVLRDISCQSFPLSLLKENSTRHDLIRGFDTGGDVGLK